MATLFTKTTTKIMTFEDYESQVKNDFENPGDPLLVWFNYAYYLCLCPFRLKYCSKSYKYKIHKNFIQKVFCILMTIGRIMFAYVYAQWNLYDVAQTDLRYFTITQNFSDMMHLLCFVVFVWSNPYRFEALINYYHQNFRQPPSPPGKSRWCFRLPRLRIRWVTLGLLFIVMSLKILLEIAGILVHYPRKFELIQNRTESVHYDYWLDCSTELKTEYDLILVPMDPIEYLLQIGEVFTENMFLFDIFKYRFDISAIVPYTTPCFILLTIRSFAAASIFLSITICSAWSILSAVRKARFVLANATIDEGMELFRKLKRLTVLNNSALDLAIFSCVFFQIPFLMFTIPKLLQPRDAWQFFNCSLDAITIWGFLVMSSLIVSISTATFEHWLIEAEKHESMQEADRSILLYELSQKQIAISATSLVKLNAGFLGAVINLVLTFSVVIIQFNHSNTTDTTGKSENLLDD